MNKQATGVGGGVVEAVSVERFDLRKIDEKIGERVRQARMRRDMSQQALGEALGISFQQVQKYERGSNRISGSRMAQISKVLGVTVAELFKDIDGEDVGPPLSHAILRTATRLSAIAEKNPQLATRIRDMVHETHDALFPDSQQAAE